MLRLSSIFKPRLRPWIAVASVGFLVAMLVVGWWDARRRGEVPWLLVGVSVPLIGGLCAHVRNGLVTGMVDEAWIDGDELVLRVAGRPIRMPLANVAGVDVAPGGLAMLQLSMPCTLGSRVRFMVSRASRSDLERQLRRRIDDVRGRRA